MSKIVEYTRDKKSYDMSGVIEKLADTKTPWWMHMIDLFHNFHQGQPNEVDAYVRFTQIDDKYIKFEVWEENGTGVGMLLKTVDEKYLRTLTIEEFKKIPEEEKSKGDLGVHTMGVPSFVAKMNNRNPEAIKEGVVLAIKTENCNDYTFLNRHSTTLEDIIPPTYMSEDELEQEGVPVSRMGSKGLYMRIPKCDTSEWGDDWFDTIVKLTEYYFKFAMEKRTINFTFEYVNSKGKSNVVKPKPLIQPCVNGAPYYDVWERGTVEIGGKTFTVKALERPKKQVLKDGHDFEVVRRKYSNRYFRHPIVGTEFDYRDNLRIIYEDKKTGVILGQEIIKPGNVRNRGDIRILIDKRDVKTDTAKSMITFKTRHGKPYTRNTKYEPHNFIKESFDSLFPKTKEDEHYWRVIIKDILTGKQWPDAFNKVSYIALCNDIELTPFDYSSVKKSLTSIKVLDSEIDLYFSDVGKILELKIVTPKKDPDYNQFLAYLSLFMSPKCNYPFNEFIMLGHSENDDSFGDDLVEKFETKLNVHFEGVCTFKLLNLKDYGLDSTCIHN